MDFKQLKYFYTIAEEEQITSAAKRLHIAQPPLSYQLKMLEEELGVKLLERGSRKIQLTDAGKILHERAEQILELTESTVKELKDFSKGVEGTLSLGTVSSSGSILLTDRLIKFHNMYPNVNFELFEGNTFKVMEMLNRGIIDIGIVRTPFNKDGLESIYLPKEPMFAVMDKHLDWDENKSNITLAELENRPLVIYRRFEKLIFKSCEKFGFEPKIFCKNDDARTTLLWAKMGMCIAIVPKSAFNLIGSENLVNKEINEPDLATQIAAIWMKDRYLSSAARNFLESFKL